MRDIRASELRRYLRSIQKSDAGLIKEAHGRVQRHVFLSHSHVDRPALGGAIALFDHYKAPAYLDFQDHTLPSVTSSTTAHGLREAIDSCARLVVAASGQLRRSRWVPWEIGYADGSKGLWNIALLPIEPDGDQVGIEQEYLDSYPRIRFAESQKDLIVLDPRDNNYWSLKDWLFKKIS